MASPPIVGSKYARQWWRFSTSEVFPSIQHFFRDSLSLDMVGAVVKLLLDLRYLRTTGIRNLLQYRFELTDLLIAAG